MIKKKDSISLVLNINNTKAVQIPNKTIIYFLFFHFVSISNLSEFHEINKFFRICLKFLNALN